MHFSIVSVTCLSIAAASSPGVSKRNRSYVDLSAQLMSHAASVQRMLLPWRHQPEVKTEKRMVQVAYISALSGPTMPVNENMLKAYS